MPSPGKPLKLTKVNPHITSYSTLQHLILNNPQLIDTYYYYLYTLFVCIFTAAILAEREEITRVGFIQTGSCVAYVKVPRAPRQTQVNVQINS